MVPVFSNTLITLPPKKHTQKVSSRITTEDYLATTFNWLRIVNQHLKYAPQEVQKYKDLSLNLRNKNIYTTKMCTNMAALMAVPPEEPKGNTKP